MSDLTPGELRALPLGRLLLQAHRRAQAASLAKLQSRGHSEIRLGHLPVITNLDPAGTRITDLAARAGMTRQMAGRLVKELEVLGYVSSRQDPNDQRAVVVALTARGTDFLADAPAAMSEVDGDFAALLGSDELARLRESLVRITTT
ncbi:winged helix-turn-helix transcriptional regulator [Dactylosporangium aurantiacum]|uniref:Winged helix-turn-helix transcriptional regulator n=1 Tax=Dactylosporangium aurantiacum TaxID=35754 RepID=A0A9Q9IPQ3_9ACTN|nr:MarR family winged helix-turn-helix transcriptional regulator [Dactylosporangium aurantiacum]MDG6104210.1 MarR family winged helix-turn-helix transcriptional regulator [Dactylosporangium aurantiacum]UWZ56788.1 winged helix-turn-helix transcriptional regulator [Dactylosporangium aurantiacum]